MEPNAHNPGTCTQCGKEGLRGDRVSSAFWHEGRLVVIEDIPALICDSCQERFYDDNTVILIDQMRGDGFRLERAHRELRVPVFRFMGPPGGEEKP